MAEGNVLKGQVRNDIEPSGGPTTAISDGFMHLRSLQCWDYKFNDANADLLFARDKGLFHVFLPMMAQ